MLTLYLKKACEKDGGKLIRKVKAADGFTATVEVENKVIAGDVCMRGDEKLFMIGGFHEGAGYFSSANNEVRWFPVVIYIWHKDTIKGVRPYSQLIAPDPDYKGKKATEVFGPDKISAFIMKMKDIKYDYGNFVVGSGSIRDKGAALRKFKIINEMVSFCNANGGQLYKDGIPIDEFMIKVVIEKNKLHFGNGAVFEGKYICKSPIRGFTIKLSQVNQKTTYISPYAHDFSYRLLIKDEIEQIQMASSEPLPEQIKEKDSAEASDIALETAKNKSGVIKQIGGIAYLSKYNGKDKEGCDLVSIIKTITAFSKKEILNFKVCNGNAIPLGNTPPESIAKKVILKAKILAKSCKLYNIRSMDVDNYQLRCFPLNDYEKCLYEIRYFRDGRLIKTEQINACRL